MTEHQRKHRNPLAGIVDFVGDMNRGWDLVYNIHSRPGQPRTDTDAWVPATDIAATDDQLVITMDLPGIADDDIEVTYTAPTLTVTGQRRSTDDKNSRLVHHTRERSQGRFRRSITLPGHIQRDDLTITSTHGVLTITAPQPDTGDNHTMPITTDEPA